VAEVSSGTTMVGSTTVSSSGSTGKASVSLIAHFLIIQIVVYASTQDG
jgi:hypothetical protein